MLQVAACVLAAQVGVRPVGLQPGVRIPPELGAGRHAARGSVPHRRRPGARGARRAPGAGRRAEARPPPGTDGSAVSGGRASPWAAGGAAVAAAGSLGLRASLARPRRWACPRPTSARSARLQPPRRPYPAAAMAGAAQAPSPRFPLGARVQAAASARGSGSSGRDWCPREQRRGDEAAEAGTALGSAWGGRRGAARRRLGARPAPAPPLPAALEADRGLEGGRGRGDLTAACVPGPVFSGLRPHIPRPSPSGGRRRAFVEARGARGCARERRGGRSSFSFF